MIVEGKRCAAVDRILLVAVHPDS